MPCFQPLYSTMVNNMSSQLTSKMETKNSAPVLMLKSWAIVNKITRKLKYRKTHDVLAVTIGSTLTLVWGNLHKALLTSTTDSIWVAAAFLHRERRKHDRRD